MVATTVRLFNLGLPATLLTSYRYWQWYLRAYLRSAWRCISTTACQLRFRWLRSVDIVKTLLLHTSPVLLVHFLFDIETRVGLSVLFFVPYYD